MLLLSVHIAQIQIQKMKRTCTTGNRVYSNLPITYCVDSSRLCAVDVFIKWEHSRPAITNRYNCSLLYIYRQRLYGSNHPVRSRTMSKWRFLFVRRRSSTMSVFNGMGRRILFWTSRSMPRSTLSQWRNLRIWTRLVSLSVCQRVFGSRLSNQRQWMFSTAVFRWCNL